jgi:hypothetical protein
MKPFPLLSLHRLAWIALLTIAAPTAALADTTTPRVKAMLVLGFWSAVIVCAALFTHFWLKARRYRRAVRDGAQWPHVPGKILESKVDERYPLTRFVNMPLMYFPAVRYGYEAGGEKRQGTVLQAGIDDLGFVTPDLARARLVKYPPGAAVTVYYDPADPAAAVLETGQQRFAAGLAFFRAAICAILAVGALVLAVWAMGLEGV